MIVFIIKGESGLGKSTLINSLFLTDLYSDREILPVSGLIPSLRMLSKPWHFHCQYKVFLTFSRTPQENCQYRIINC